MRLIDLHPDLEDVDDYVEVTFPGLPRPGLLHVPTMRVLPPLAGADGADDDTDADGADDDDDTGDDDDTDEKGKSKSKSKSKADDDTGHDEALEAARKAAAKANSELKRIRRKAEQDEQAAKAKAGEWEELYNEEKTKREELETAAEQAAIRTLAESALTRLRCKNPSRYARLLDLDKIDDESSAERAAKRLQKSDPDLFGKASTRQMRGAGKADDDDDDDDDTKRNGGRRSTRPVNRLRAGLEAKT